MPKKLIGFWRFQHIQSKLHKSEEVLQTEGVSFLVIDLLICPHPMRVGDVGVSQAYFFMISTFLSFLLRIRPYESAGRPNN